MGQDGVDKRIDVLATAMRAGLSATDLIDLELAYAPPFGSAKDPINQLGYIAENRLAGLSNLSIGPRSMNYARRVAHPRCSAPGGVRAGCDSGRGEHPDRRFADATR